jgi:hypothetical protein
VLYALRCPDENTLSDQHPTPFYSVRALRMNVWPGPKCGAPDGPPLGFAAVEKTSFLRDLCRDAPINTVFTVRRTCDAQGQIKEECRTIRPPTGDPLHAKLWTVVDDEA